jgi:hypothetical protein
MLRRSAIGSHPRSAAAVGAVLVAIAAGFLVFHLRSGVASAPEATAPPRDASVCTRFASVVGNDDASGGALHPFATVQRLVSALRPGESGCLLGGTYTGDVTIRRGGRKGAPVVLRSAPGETATVTGRLWVAHGADWVVISRLHLDGRNAHFLPSPTVNSDHVTFAGDDVTNDHMGGVDDGDGICFDLGDPTGRYGLARWTTIEGSTIHDCGRSNNHNHGIYVAGSYGARIVGNWIWDNADRGIQLYPDAQHTLIERNIIADNGEGVIFSGDTKHASSHNTLVHNVIVGSRLRHNVESWWPGPVGTDNVVEGNCLYGARQGNVAQPEVGFEAHGNLIVQPKFVGDGQPAKIASGTPCARYAPG